MLRGTRLHWDFAHFFGQNCDKITTDYPFSCTKCSSQTNSLVRNLFKNKIHSTILNILASEDYYVDLPTLLKIAIE